MSSRFTFSLLNLLAVFTALILAPIAHAEQWDKETIVTFNHAVEVPGQVLPAGTYVFKIAGSQSDRQIVQIFTQDKRRVLAMVQGIPDYRSRPSDKPVISFEERPSGKPEALQSWFYPGENYGVHFVYSEGPTELPANPDAQVATNEKPEVVPPLTEAIAPPLSDLASSPVFPVLTKPEPDRQVLAENTAPKPMQSSMTVLPATAGNYAMLPLVGFLFLGSGLVIRRIRARSHQ